MRRLVDAMQGKPGERRGDFEGGQKIGLWSGPQTYAGRQMTFGGASTKFGAGEEGQSRVEQVKAGTYSFGDPIGRGSATPKLRSLWDSANTAVYNATGRRMPGLSANAQFQQFIQGTDEETQNFNNFIELFRQRAKEAGVDQKEVEEYVQAEHAKRQLEGDPRAAAMNVGEGTPAFVRPMESPQVVPPEQSIVDPTQQETSAVQNLVDQYGQPIYEPVNPNPSDQIINPQSQV